MGKERGRNGVCVEREGRSSHVEKGRCVEREREGRVCE